MSQENHIEKKGNPKVIVIALALICVILAASLVGILTVFKPNDNSSQLAEKDAAISSLQQQLAVAQSQLSHQANASTYVTQIAYLNQQLTALNDTLSTAYSDLSSLESVLALEASGVLFDDVVNQNATTSTSLWNNQLDYAGAVLIESTATSNTTYTQVIYTYNGYSFDYNRTLGTEGTTLFPVLPGTVEVRIGNLNPTEPNNATVTVTYIY